MSEYSESVEQRWEGVYERSSHDLVDTGFNEIVVFDVESALQDFSGVKGFKLFPNDPPNNPPKPWQSVYMRAYRQWLHDGNKAEDWPWRYDDLEAFRRNYD